MQVVSTNVLTGMNPCIHISEVFQQTCPQIFCRPTISPVIYINLMKRKQTASKEMDYKYINN